MSRKPTKRPTFCLRALGGVRLQVEPEKKIKGKCRAVWEGCMGQNLQGFTPGWLDSFINIKVK